MHLPAMIVTGGGGGGGDAVMIHKSIIQGHDVYKEVWISKIGEVEMHDQLAVNSHFNITRNPNPIKKCAPNNQSLHTRR